MGVVVFPDENDPPLLVDAEAVELPQLSGELLKAITRRNPQVVQFRGGMELIELHFRTGLNVSRQFAGWFEIKNLSGLGIGKAFDHATLITEKENRRNRKLPI